VSLSPDVQPDDLSVKAEYANFLEHTCLDEIRPGAKLDMTMPNQYQFLEAQIEAHSQRPGVEQEQALRYEEAVGRWYDEVYLPVAQTICQQDILRDFPGRTETDLYVWLSQHQQALAQKLGHAIEIGAAAADLVAQFSPTLPHIFARTKERLLDAVTPDQLEAGPTPGRWRRERLATRQANCLFADILVAISGAEIGWRAMEQALEVARREGGQLHGLHVLSPEARENNETVQKIQAEFKRYCQAGSLQGELVIKAGGVVRQLCEQARWADLVVVSLAHPPASKPLARLGSKFSTLLRRCPRSVLVVPTLPHLPSQEEQPQEMKRALLAYDGSPKANEALFMAARLAASEHWNLALTVLTVTEGDRLTEETLAQAQKYLEGCGVQATFIQQRGPVAEVILKTAATCESNLIILGSYGFNPVLEIMLGSTVDQVLRASRQPVLVCR
jgi:nucleotide-binding universal stress UspA family protein